MEEAKLELTADIVAAFVSKNHIQADAVAGLIKSVHDALNSVGEPVSVIEIDQTADHKTKAEIKKSIQPDYLISFLDGRKMKSLKRHLTGHGLTPSEYRERFGLPDDYPMVAPNYAAQRSALAKAIGLGSGGRKPAKKAVGRPKKEPA